MRERVEVVIERVRNHLRMDGANIELLEISPDRVVTIKLTGWCMRCPMSQMALITGLENALRDEADVKKVVLVRA